jgi:hypothetical protein
MTQIAIDLVPAVSVMAVALLATWVMTALLVLALRPCHVDCRSSDRSETTSFV